MYSDGISNLKYHNTSKAESHQTLSTNKSYIDIFKYQPDHQYTLTSNSVKLFKFNFNDPLQ